MLKNMTTGIIVLLLLFSHVQAFADIKEDIYSKLKCCNCGKEFKPCSCEHAKEIKTYIDALLEFGLREEEIFTKIATKYTLDTIIDNKTRADIEKILIAEAGDKRPQIHIDSISNNLGKISKSKGKIELKVKVNNKGNDVLKITDLKTTCACTTVIFKSKIYTSPVFSTEGAGPEWEVNIAPDGEGELVIVTDLSHSHVHLGRMVRTVEIKSNDPVHSLTKVEFEAEIIQ